MSVGPITIFDKSALELLDVDEACLVEHFYRVTLTPLFLIETLADFEKEVAAGRTPQQFVGSIAHRTSGMTAGANVHHLRICPHAWSRRRRFLPASSKSKSKRQLS